MTAPVASPRLLALANTLRDLAGGSHLLFTLPAPRDHALIAVLKKHPRLAQAVAPALREALRVELLADRLAPPLTLRRRVATAGVRALAPLVPVRTGALRDALRSATATLGGP